MRGYSGILHHYSGVAQPARANVLRLARCSHDPALPPALACIPGCVRRTHYVVPHSHDQAKSCTCNELNPY